MSRTLSLILLALFILSLTPSIPLASAAKTTPIYITSTKTIDGKVNDWSTSIPPNNNTWWFDDALGELIWKDPINDTYNYLDPYAPGTQGDNRLPYADIVEFHISGDTDYLYFMVRFNDTSEITLGQGGATFLAIAIDTTPGSGETYFAGNSETQTDTVAAWERQIVVNLAGKYADGTTPSGTELVAGLQNNWGTFFYLVDNTWNFVDDPNALLAVNLTEGIIELRVSWSALGITLSGSDIHLNITVMSALGYSNNEGDGGTWDNDIDSDAVDAVTGLAATIDEINDGVINYYLPVVIDGTTGEVKHGSKAFVEVGVYPTTIKTGDTYDLWVHMYDELGLPITGAHVTIKENGVDFSSGYTDPWGYYALHGLTKTTPGTYVYTAVSDAYDGYPANTTEASSATLRVLATATKLLLYTNVSSVYLGTPIKIYGYLEQNETGTWEPIANENVSIYIDDNFIANATTNDTGYFELNTTAPIYIGDHTIKASYPGNETAGYPAVENTTVITTYGIREIDGSPDDWVGVLPPRDNMWNVSNNELVWRDALGDTRTDADSTYANASIVSDISEFRVTIDEYYIYFELKMKDIQKLGVAGAPILDIAIDRDQAGGSGQSWLPGYSDTKAGYYNRWEYALRLDLSNSAVSSSGTYRGGTSWSAALTVSDSGFNALDASNAWFAVDNTTETIEIAVPWDIIGGAPSPGDALRFVVITGVGDQSGDFFDISDSDALDAVTGYEPNTWDEVGDGYVDYALTVQVQSGYMIYPGSAVFIYWISPTPDNGSHVAANTPITLKIHSRDSLYNDMSHFIFNLVNVTSGKVIAKSEADGLGDATFTISLPVGEHHLKVTFNGTGLIPSGESDELVLYAEPIYPSYLTLSYELVNDADGNGYITPGDTVRFTVNLTYYNSTDGKYYPLSGANVTLNSTEAGVYVNLTTDANGIATYDWVVPKLGTPKFLAFEANYTGNATATETPRFSGSADYVSVPYYIARIVDGNINDWTGTPPATTPGISASGMEMIITDPTGDERKEYSTQYNWPHPADLDIKQVRLLIDNYTIYGMAEFAGNVSPHKWLAIAIDVYPFNDTSNYWILEDTAYGNRLGYVMPGTYDEAGKIYALSWDYVLLIRYGETSDDKLVLWYINTTYAYRYGSVKSLDNGGSIEFYFPLYKVNLTGIFLGKPMRVWAMTFAADYGSFWNPAAQVGSPVQPRVYDIAGVTGTINVEVYDTDANVANDVFPYSDHWIETGFEFTLDSTGKPSLPATTTVNTVTVVYHADNISIGEVGPVALIVDNHEERHWIELKDHDTGALITSGITALNGIARLGVTFSTRGLHTVDVYVDGNLLTSFTVNVTGYSVTITIDKVEVDLGAGTLHVVAHATYLNGTELPLSVADLSLSLVYMINDLNASIAAGRPVYVLTSYEISLGTYTTNATGYIDTTITLPTPPAGYPEGGYILKITYAGNETFAPSETHNAPAEGPWFIPVFNTLPTVTWTLTGTDTGVYIGSGELLFKDTAGDENTKVYWSGGHAHYLPNPGAADNLYVRMKIAGNYLVVEAQYNYDLSTIYSMGATAPFLVIGLDTTPADTTDGVDSYLWLPSSYAFGFASSPVSPQIAGLLNFYKENTPVKYTHALVITPVEGSRVAESYVVWLVTVSGGKVIAEPVGVLEVVDPANGVMRAYIPLSVLGITTTGDVRVWVASGAEYVGGFIWGAQTNNTDPYYDHTMVFDIPGYPVTTLNTESAKYNWSLLVTLDPTNGFTKIYGRVVPVTLPMGVDEGKLYVGPAANHTFTMRLLGSESDYRLIGLSVTLNYNTTTHTGTTGTDGLVTFQFQVPNADAGKNVTITFTGTTPLEVAAAPTYNLHVLYYTRIVNATMTWYDLDHDGLVSRGDKLSFYTKVEVYDENGNWVPTAGIKVSFWVYSTPYLLGSNTTDNNGVAIFNYTVTGNEGIVGIHNFVAQAGDNIVSGVTSTVVTGGANIQVFMQPAPEPPILPIILLAAILLFIIIKKRK